MLRFPGGSRRSSDAVLAAVSLVVLLAGAPAYAQNQHIRIVVHNRAQLLPDLLEDAEKVTSEIFRAAEVDIEWFHVSPAFHLPAGPSPVIRAIIVSRGDGSSMNPPADALGFTPSRQSHGSGLTYILEDRLDAVAKRLSIAKPVVLGVAVAHEIGHVLLPSQGHSKTGVMSALFDQALFRAAARGALTFTPMNTTGLHAMIARMELDLRQTLLHE
jgi:hypothetical protein